MPLILENFPPKRGLGLEGGIMILPSNLAPRRHIRNILDKSFILHTLPFAFQLERDGFLHDVVRHLPLERLAGINQLQKLTWLRVGEGLPVHPGPHIFDHNRLVHSLWAAVGHALMNRKLGINGPEALIGILTEAVHDSFTSAGGDIMQTMFPKFFDEDARVELLFKSKKYREGWKYLQRKYCLPSDTGERVRDAVNGKGLHGHIHEIADTWSYMACDLDAIVRAYSRLSSGIPSHFGETITGMGGKALDIWKHIAVDGDSVYVTDPEVLYDFLKLRIELWRGIYNHPGHKILEYLFRRVFMPLLFSARKVKRSQLFLWTDKELGESLTRWLGLPDPMHVSLGSVFPRIVPFENWAEARKAEEKVARQGHLTLLQSKKGDRPIKPKTGSYFVRVNGRTETFAQASPEKSVGLANLAKTLPLEGSVWLIHYPGALRKLPKEAVEAWRRSREAWDRELLPEMVA